MTDPALPLDCRTCVKRRDMLTTGIGAMAAIGVAGATIPVVDSLRANPDDVAVVPLDVDLRDLAPGTQKVVSWQSRPIFIVHRSPAELAALRDPASVASLRDPDSRVLQQPAYAANWHRSADPAYLVLVGICTHLGCVPNFEPGHGVGGYLCPCHNSHFDLAGRVRKGSPAPYNLPVPPYTMGKDAVRLGDNPAGQSFSLDDVVQL